MNAVVKKQMANFQQEKEFFSEHLHWMRLSGAGQMGGEGQGRQQGKSQSTALVASLMGGGNRFCEGMDMFGFW